ncbi:hypothetical protein CS542_01940 [Pedobacter sp. IW39]|nr:hypothetical protein CS542_01940 [Pedobacter sp. IW39]
MQCFTLSYGKQPVSLHNSRLHFLVAYVRSRKLIFGIPFPSTWKLNGSNHQDQKILHQNFCSIQLRNTAHVNKIAIPIYTCSYLPGSSNKTAHIMVIPIDNVAR